MAMKSDMLSALRDLLRSAFAAQYGGASGGKLSRAFGYADGYMRAMLEGGMASREELLDVVVEERRTALCEPEAMRPQSTQRAMTRTPELMGSDW